MAELSGERRFDWVPMAMAGGALVLGLIFRFWGAASQPLWLDEAYSAFAADHSFVFLWQVVPHYETHPPFYYTLLRCWRLIVGDGLLASRLLGLLCGLATLVLGGVIAQRLGRLTRLRERERRALVAVTLVLLSLHPLIIAMSRQVRPYPVMILVYAAALPALLRLVDDSICRRMPDRRALVAVFVSQALMAWLHSLGPLFAFALGLALAAAAVRPGLTRADWRWLIGGELAVGLIYLPALMILREQAPDWVASSWLSFTTASLPARVGQIYLDWNLWGRLIGLAAALMAIGLLLGRIGGRRLTAILILLAGVPMALSLLLSLTVAPVFLDRTLSPVVVPAMLLVATGLVWSAQRAWLGWLALLVIAGSMAGIDRLQMKMGPPQDWYGTIAWLEPRLERGDRVWAYPNEGALPLDYALGDEGRRWPVRSIPGPVPAFGSGGFFPSGSRGVVSLHPRQIAALMATAGAKAPPTIWLLRLNAPIYDPDDGMLHALEQDRRVAAHFRRGPIDLVGLRRKDLGPAVATAGPPGPNLL